MSQPTVNSWNKLKRIARYLERRPRIVHTYEWQSPCAIDVFVDTDGRMQQDTQVDISRGHAEGHLLRHWSSTQTTVAFSSGDAELRGIAKETAHGLGLQSIGIDFGIEMEVTIHTDSKRPRSWLPGKDWAGSGTSRCRSYGSRML